MDSVDKMATWIVYVFIVSIMVTLCVVAIYAN